MTATENRGGVGTAYIAALVFIVILPTLPQYPHQYK